MQYDFTRCHQLKRYAINFWKVGPFEEWNSSISINSAKLAPRPSKRLATLNVTRTPSQLVRWSDALPPVLALHTGESCRHKTDLESEWWILERSQVQKDFGRWWTVNCEPVPVQCQQWLRKWACRAERLSDHTDSLSVSWSRVMSCKVRGPRSRARKRNFWVRFPKKLK